MPRGTEIVRSLWSGPRLRTPETASGLGGPVWGALAGSQRTGCTTGAGFARSGPSRCVFAATGTTEPPSCEPCPLPPHAAPPAARNSAPPTVAVCRQSHWRPPEPSDRVARRCIRASSHRTRQADRAVAASGGVLTGPRARPSSALRRGRIPSHWDRSTPGTENSPTPSSYPWDPV